MHHDPDGLLLVRDADVGLRHARLCVARARAAARTLRSARPWRIIGSFVFGRPWTGPGSGDDESGRREHAAANAAREAGTIQLTKHEHKREHARSQTLAGCHGAASCLEQCTSDDIWRLVMSLKNRNAV